MAVAAMDAFPNSPPCTCGCTTGEVLPLAMKTLAGVTAAIPGAFELKFTVTPPAGAAAESATGRGDELPGAKERVAGACNVPKVRTVTAVLAPVNPGMMR